MDLIINGNDNSFGDSVSNAGDINGDGFADVIIGASLAPSNSGQGEAYLVFGNSNLRDINSISVADFDGTNGLKITANDPNERNYYFSSPVSNAGDINGDGFDDLIISVFGLYPFGDGTPGESYVIFGGNSVGGNGTLDVSELNGNNGFVFNGIESYAYNGIDVSNAGDINGDGFDDLIIATFLAGDIGDISTDLDFDLPYLNLTNAKGKSYIIFGGNDIGDNGNFDLSSLDGTNGFVTEGINEFDLLGFDISSAGDLNGDGLDDLIIAARGSYSQENGGEAYVIFGDSNLGGNGNFDLTSLNGNNGFVIPGIDPSDRIRSVSNLGDVNGDGFDDIIIGSPNANPNNQDDAGEAYLIFGDSNIGGNGNFDLTSLNGNNGFAIQGENGFQSTQRLGYEVNNAGDVNNDGFADFIVKTQTVNDYLIFGSRTLGSSGKIAVSELNEFNSLIISSSGSAGDVDGDGFDDLIGQTGARVAIKFGQEFINKINGTSESDALTGTSEGNLISGLAGDDTIKALDGNDLIRGGTGNDSLYGNKGDDIIEGNAGDDTLNGNMGNDILRGGQNQDLIMGKAGNDSLFGGEGDDTLLGHANNDSLDGNAGDDILNGNMGNDILRGNIGNDTLNGHSGEDNLQGGEGNDLVFGETGNDFLFGGDGDDTLWGQADNDTILGGNSSDRILGNNGLDVLEGGDGSDTIFGGNNNDVLRGDDGNDLLFGNAGDDTLDGGKGLDTLWGDAGADVFIISKGTNVSRIKDYLDGEDRIKLGSNLSFNDLVFVQNGLNAQIRVASNNEFLAAVENTNIADFDPSDFLVD